MTAPERVRAYWDTDAATYDRSPSHWPGSAVEQSAWRGALSHLLPASAAQRVLDVGAGTGFLTMRLAEMGHQVTAVDLSPGMLGRLQDKAAQAGLSVTIFEGDATDVPPGPFDVVVARHLLWLLPDPVAALRSWHQAAPDGRLVLVESAWGRSADGPEKLRRVGRQALNLARRTPPAHHAEFGNDLSGGLPLGHGPAPAELVDAVTAAGWAAARLHRLTGVEWAMRGELPWPDRLLGVTSRFAIVAGQ